MPQYCTAITFAHTLRSLACRDVCMLRRDRVMLHSAADVCRRHNCWVCTPLLDVLDSVVCRPLSMFRDEHS